MFEKVLLIALAISSHENHAKMSYSDKGPKTFGSMFFSSKEI